jgi:hypothetical protein
LPEHDRAVGVFDVLAQPDANVGVGQELRQRGATARPRLVAQTGEAPADRNRNAARARQR